MTQSSGLRKGFHSQHYLTSFFKTLVDGPPRFELTTSLSADRRSSSWANLRRRLYDGSPGEIDFGSS